jgi:hypothetical protein
MEGKMARAVSRRQRDRGRIVRGQCAVRLVEFPHQDLVESEISGEDESAGGVGLDHVRVRAIVAADREAPGRPTARPHRPGLALMALDVGRGTEPAIRLNRQHRDRPAAVVGDQRVLARRMDAHVGRPRTFRADAVEQQQLTGRAIDGVRAH